MRTRRFHQFARAASAGASRYPRCARRLRRRQGSRDRGIGVLAVPPGNAQQAANDLIDAGVKIIFNYSEALLDVPGDVSVHTSNPAVDLLYALYFHLT